MQNDVCFRCLEKSEIYSIIYQKTGGFMASNCETCINYIYDEEEECYCCDMNLDEDDMVKFLTGSFEDCPYYQLDDEYAIVKHQM